MWFISFTDSHFNGVATSAFFFDQKAPIAQEEERVVRSLAVPVCIPCLSKILTPS